MMPVGTTDEESKVSDTGIAATAQFLRQPAARKSLAPGIERNEEYARRERRQKPRGFVLAPQNRRSGPRFGKLVDADRGKPGPAAEFRGPVEIVRRELVLGAPIAVCRWRSDAGAPAEFHTARRSSGASGDHSFSRL